jgi:transposase InsO family protein
MPWEKRTVEKQRIEFVEEILRGENSKSELCRRYGITRRTGDKWLNRFKRGETLADRSHAPFHTPNKTPHEIESAVLEKRRKHPAWGPRKIHRILEREARIQVPAPSTIADILKRNGCISEEASQAAKPYKRFQKAVSNEMWQTDFKGYFTMLDSNRCYPLTVLDDYSRYSLCVDAKGNERREGVVNSFTRLFETYGMPDSLLCDNGNPWGSSQSTGYTLFEIWLMDLGILPIHGRPYHPQTQGKEERFHRTLNEELLKFVKITDIHDAQIKFDVFRECYNNERPHEALGLDVPADHYRPSIRMFSDKIREWIYPSNFVTRKIKSTGYITYGNQGYYLSESFGGYTLGIRESRIDGCINLYYKQFRIARIDLREKAIISRKIYRADNGDVGGERDEI